MRWNTGYEAETYDVIVICQTPQADPEARAQPSFKNSHTLKFRRLFVAVSVISVASLGLSISDDDGSKRCFDI